MKLSHRTGHQILLSAHGIDTIGAKQIHQDTKGILRERWYRFLLVKHYGYDQTLRRDEIEAFRQKH